jgi:transcriptional regulator with XRE-family HTH domain
MISQKFIDAVKLHNMKAYEIANTAGISQSQLSHITNKVRNVEPEDVNVLKVAAIIGLKPEDCFE